jgi:hypothetical protein
LDFSCNYRCQKVVELIEEGSMPMPPVNGYKLRGFVVDKHSGRPLRGVSVLAVAEPDENVFVPLGMLTSDLSGYVSFDLNGMLPENQPPKRLWVSALGDQTNKINLAANLQLAKTAPHFVLRVDARLANNTNGNALQPSIKNPDPLDWELSPNSFSTKPEVSLGDGACQSPLPAMEGDQVFHFNRIVRRPSGPAPNPRPVGIIPVNVSMNLTTDLRSEAELQFADVFEFRQEWKPIGYSLGSMAYSLPLAPCESVNLVVIDWLRQDTITRKDILTAKEELFHKQHRNRTIEETVRGALDESQGGFSLMGGLAGAISGAISSAVPIVGALTAAVGAVTTSSSGERDLTAKSVQELDDLTTQRSAAMRSLESTVVIQASQEETNFLQTRTVTNHNHCHALTIQYYEVLRNFKITTEFVAKRKAILVPYALIHFTDVLALRFRTILERALLDPELIKCFDAMIRLKHCTNLYSEERPPVQPEKEPARIGRYELILETGERQTWGPVWVKLVLKGGEAKVLLFKQGLWAGDDKLGSEGVAGYALESNTTKSVDIISGEAIGLNPSDIERVQVEWVEANGDDAWAFKGIAIRYELSHPNVQQGTLLINGTKHYSKDPYIQRFDNSGHTHQSWYGMVRAVTDEIEPSDPMAVNTDPEEPDVKKYSRSEDECCQNVLLNHLNGNIGYYNRAIWLLQDPVERRLYLEIALASYPEVLARIEDTPLAVSGNSVAFGFALDDRQATADRPGWNLNEDVKVSRVTLPTRGLFAEAQLGHCNACEKRDVTRFWKWDESPCDKPPTIDSIRPGPQGQTPSVTPSTLPSSIVNIMQPPAAPDPVGLAAALNVLGTPNIFRDMSGLDEVSGLLDKLASGSVSSLQEAQKVAQQAQSRLKTQQAKAAAAGTRPQQSPEQRFDNLNVAKEAAEAADNLGMSSEGQQRIFESVLGTQEAGEVVYASSIVDDDVKKAYHWRDLISFMPPSDLLSGLKTRSLTLQKIDDGYGDVNLDWYRARIDRLPNNPADGIQFTEKSFIDHVRKNFPSLLIEYPDIGGPSLVAYKPSDETKWSSANPLGAVMKFRIDPGPGMLEEGLVLCAETKDTDGDWHWNFATVTGPDPIGYHPVSGTRQFGLRREGESLVFFIRGADRVTTWVDRLASRWVFSGAEAYWNGFFRKFIAFIEKLQGHAVLETEVPSIPGIRFPYSRRLPWESVKKAIDEDSIKL